MSDQGRKSRKDNRDKARRLTEGRTSGRIDASGWSEPKDMNTTAKTGARPISPRAYKHGGKIQGDRARRADKLPRGGKDSNPKEVNDKVNRNTKAANEEQLGKFHVGAFKGGGRAKKNMGGPMIDPRATADMAMKAAADRGGVSPSRMAFTDVAPSRGLMGAAMGRKSGGKVPGGEDPVGGRIARKDGGRAKSGKTNINIVIQPPKSDQPPASMMPPGPVRPPAPPVMPPAGAPPPGMPMGGPPPGPPPGGPPPGMPPMARASGGRTALTSFKPKAGAGSGLGRLEKAHYASRNG